MKQVGFPRFLCSRVWIFRSGILGLVGRFGPNQAWFGHEGGQGVVQCESGLVWCRSGFGLESSNQDSRWWSVIRGTWLVDSCSGWWGASGVLFWWSPALGPPGLGWECMGAARVWNGKGLCLGRWCTVGKGGVWFGGHAVWWEVYIRNGAFDLGR